MHGLTILTPVFNDWESLGGMLGELDRALDRDALTAEVLVVDDGSTVPLRSELADRHFTRISRVEVLHLRRNLGHQRAIAIGLAFIYGERPCEAVVVMDADGQDRPSDVPALVRRFQEEGARKIVFASRARRSESLFFKTCYHGYRAVHKVLTGVSVRVGNFSILPFWALGSLVAVSELWNHYSAAVFKAKLPYATIPTHRAPRIAGDPRMNFFTLVLHGMSALSVFGDVIGVRLLVAASALLALVSGGFGVTFLGQFRAGAPGPGLALFLLGILLILTVQLVAMACALIFGVLGGRANLTFLPIRDYRHFVREVSKTFESARVN
jgi:glycosyltransferase involved in cell wall biosynthesis